MAFVTFNSVNGAKFVYEDHEPSLLSRYNKKPAISSLRYDKYLSHHN